MPGIIGLIQATEVIKFILKKGKPLINKFLVYNSLESEFRTFSVKKNHLCPLCGEQPRIKGLGDYHDECSLPCEDQPSV